MSFLYATRTISLPVAAVGCDLRDAEGQTLATFADSFKASAIEMLVNAGIGAVEQDESAYDSRQAKIRAAFLRSITPPELQDRQASLKVGLPSIKNEA